jgi:hypothetical protein
MPPLVRRHEGKSIAVSMPVLVFVVMARVVAVTPCLGAMTSFWVVGFVVLALEQLQGGDGDGGAQTGLDEVRRSVVLGVRRLGQLVACHSDGRRANGSVDALAELDGTEQTLAVAAVVVADTLSRVAAGVYVGSHLDSKFDYHEVVA